MISFLMWLHRQSEEPSLTEVKCYWKKSTLASVGSSIKFITLDDFGASAGKVNPNSSPDEFLSSVIQKAKETGSPMQLLKHYSEEPTEKQLSIHKLVVLFLQKSGNNSADAFCNFASTQMSIDVRQKACIRQLSSQIQSCGMKICSSYCVKNLCLQNAKQPLVHL